MFSGLAVICLYTYGTTQLTCTPICFSKDDEEAPTDTVNPGVSGLSWMSQDFTGHWDRKDLEADEQAQNTRSHLERINTHDGRAE